MKIPNETKDVAMRQVQMSMMTDTLDKYKAKGLDDFISVKDHDFVTIGVGCMSLVEHCIATGDLMRLKSAMNSSMKTAYAIGFAAGSGAIPATPPDLDEIKRQIALKTDELMAKVWKGDQSHG